MKKSSIKIIAAAVLGAVLFAGCGGGDERDSSDDNGGGDTTEAPAGGDGIRVEAKEFAFDPTDIEAPADTPFTVELVNVGAIEHNFNVTGYEDQLIETRAGETATGEYTVPAGEYEIYCSIPGHKEAGMVGTLTVS